MKYILSTASIIASFLGILSIPAPAHAQILGNTYIQERIADSKGNIFQNRDDRNKLLEERIEASSTQPLTAAERQSIVIEELSVSFSNLENIYDRIDTAAAQAQTDGKDISSIESALSNASSSMDQASSTITNLVIWDQQFAPTASASDSHGVHAVIVQTIQDLESIKGMLQQAVDGLE